jgi:hypothetical protein
VRGDSVGRSGAGGGLPVRGGGLGKESHIIFCNLVHVVLVNRFPSCL